MEIHIALEQESYFLLGYAWGGVERRLVQFQHSRVNGQQIGADPSHQGHPAPWDGLQGKVTSRGVLVAQTESSATIPAISSKIPRAFQEQKHTKSRFLLCFVNNRDCVQAETT